MTFQGAVLREQGVTFAVVVVRMHVMDDRVNAEHTIDAFRPLFSGLPVVLMAQDSRGAPTYFGRRDIAAFLADLPLPAIPWQRYAA